MAERECCVVGARFAKVDATDHPLQKRCNPIIDYHLPIVSLTYCCSVSVQVTVSFTHYRVGLQETRRNERDDPTKNQ